MNKYQYIHHRFNSNETLPISIDITIDNGKPYFQNLNISKKSIMYPIRNIKYNIKNCSHSPIQYPLNSSIPGPYLQSYIAIPKKMCKY